MTDVKRFACKLPPLGAVLIFGGTVIFLLFEFVVVKAAYFKWPEDRTYESFAELLADAYTQGDAADGVYHELFGPVSFFKNYVYAFCLLCVISGIVLIARRNAKRNS